ncbi:invasion associated locus B family protein [Paracoccus alkenifer]|uniref:Invasion protein IalB, involved in pathogenesis n=1 Tax=Paracoccus alkenifer TaxID=65735 RepID=A0A1H6LZJ9_9RHOB|nr:invasion associated locus B family protein [Paracoccus alkenifer]SEH91027.1 Invasion protein IalB, involved in pathogenesis [Paracoccus alkenifer]
MARTTSAVLAALLAIAPVAGALAQSETQPETPPAAAQDAAPDTTPAEAAEAPATEPEAAESEAAPAEAAAGETAGEAAEQQPADDQIVAAYYNRESHGDWQLRCLRTPDGKDPCELYQLLRDENQGPVAEISVIPFEGQAAAIMNFVAPLETDLEMGMGLKIDAAEGRRYPFLVCAPIGCVARIGMSEAELGALKRGNQATVTLLPFGGDPEKNAVNLPVSLKGFTAGFDALHAQPLGDGPATE